MVRMIALIALILMLAACQQAPEDPTTPIGEVTRPDLVGLIDWDRSPSTVIFRAEVVGGEREEAFYSRSDVPYCTIYGDNRIIWTTSNSRSNDAVAFDTLSDDVVRTFVEQLAVEDQIYSYTAGADQLTGNDTAPVVEMLTLFVNGQVHQADSFGNWSFDYFQDVLSRCRSLALQPKEFVPDAAWVSAQRIDYDPNSASILIDESLAGLNIAELANAGEPRWVEGPAVRTLWQYVRGSGVDVQFQDDTDTYYLAVEVPNVTRRSPPAP